MSHPFDAVFQFTIGIKRVRETALPRFQTDGAAGLDLSACIEAPIMLKPGGPAILIPTGLAFQLNNLTGIVTPRSGLGHKLGLVLGNAVGVIDADFRGELMLSAWNRSSEVLFIEPGDRIAQMIFVPFIQPKIVEMWNLDVTERGAGGFGSTGVTSPAPKGE